MIKTLTSWRGIFALCIVCYHFGMHEFDQMTFAGVTFFFMLSGFLVTYRQGAVISLKQFYGHRLMRIFPLHWLALAVMIALDMAIIHKFNYGWDLPFHVTLLQSWIPQEQVYYNYSIHSWFLSSMLFCVIATPLLLKFFNKVPRTISWAMVIAACTTAAVLSLASDEASRNYFYVCPAFRLVDYSLGMMLGTTMREHRQTSHSISLAKASTFEAVILLVFAAFIAVHACKLEIALKLGNQAWWWVPMMLLIASSTLLNNHEGAIGKALTIKPLLWLGKISFELYILQKFANNLFVYAIAPFFGHFGVMIYDYSFMCTIPILIIIAWCVNRWYTRPISKLSNNRI